MEEKVPAKYSLNNQKKVVFLLLTPIVGLLLTLAGFSLIQISADLLKYIGIGLLILSLVYYFLF